MKNIQRILSAILSKNVFEYLIVDSDCRIVDFSTEVHHLLGESVGMGKDIFEYLPELVGYEETMKAVRTGEKESLSLTTVAKKDRYINIHLDYYDGEKFLILLQDITEVTRVRQETLQYSNQVALLGETLHKIINGQNALIFVANSQNRIIFANDGLIALFGLDPDRLDQEDWKIYQKLLPGTRSYLELYGRVKAGLNQVRIGDEYYLIESKRIDQANILFTLSRLTELIRKKEELQEEVTFDPLTRVYRKKYFEEAVERLLGEGKSFALAVADLDDFKQVNDRYGHIIGDKVLQDAAALMRQHVGEEGIVARWGGEEFLLLVPAESIEEAIARIEGLRQAIDAYPFEGVGHVSASFGVAWREEGDTLYSLISRADRALYRAKHAGKNRVVYLDRAEDQGSL
jgi:diguanylate cyclase (GGDEF)-like protein